MPLDRTALHPYQVTAVEEAFRNPRYMLALDMGLGKTASTLTTIADLFNHCQTFGALVVAPRRVAETVWKQEAAKWAHTQHLRVCVLRGKNKALLARELVQPFHIWVINYEALPWLFTHLNQMFMAHGRGLPFDTIVLDEITRVKNPLGARILPWYRKNKLGYCMLDYFPRRIGLTGTPSPNGYWDLFGQYFFLDGGARLGKEQETYKSMYFTENQWSRRKEPLPGAREQIQAAIADITLSMQAKDYLDLPPYIYNTITIDLPPKARGQYDDMEADMFMALDGAPTLNDAATPLKSILSAATGAGYESSSSARTLEVFNAAALTAKCRQIANGAVIDTEDNKITHAVHDAKLEALDEIMEEASGQGVFCAYIFRADLKRIMLRYKKKYRVAYLGPGVGDDEAIDIVDKWNKGNYDLLLSHPLSAAHGLNLQFGGHQIVWFGLDFGLEGWLQINARLRRQGQPSPFVTVHTILARDTIDQVVFKTLTAKEEDQQDLRDALDGYRRRRQLGVAA